MTKKSVVDFDSESKLSQFLRLKDSCEPCEATSDAQSKQGDPYNIGMDEWRVKIDQQTSDPQSLDVEIKRLIALKSFNIIGSEREPIFERITAFASRTFDVPIALVSLIDLGRQWFMSNR